MREKLATKESQGFWGVGGDRKMGDITVLCPHGNSGSMTGTICQKLQNSTLKKGECLYFCLKNNNPIVI